jgi:hypothetical protein
MQFGLDHQAADQLKLFASIIGLLWGVFKVLRSTRPETVTTKSGETKVVPKPIWYRVLGYTVAAFVIGIAVMLLGPPLGLWSL